MAERNHSLHAPPKEQAPRSCSDGTDGVDDSGLHTDEIETACRGVRTLRPRTMDRPAARRSTRFAEARWRRPSSRFRSAYRWSRMRASDPIISLFVSALKTRPTVGPAPARQQAVGTTMTTLVSDDDDDASPRSMTASTARRVRSSRCPCARRPCWSRRTIAIMRHQHGRADAHRLPPIEVDSSRTPPRHRPHAHDVAQARTACRVPATSPSTNAFSSANWTVGPRRRGLTSCGADLLPGASLSNRIYFCRRISSCRPRSCSNSLSLTFRLRRPKLSRRAGGESP